MNKDQKMFHLSKNQKNIFYVNVSKEDASRLLEKFKFYLNKKKQAPQQFAGVPITNKNRNALTVRLKDMEINGTDVYFDTEISSNEVESIVKEIVSKVWPYAVFEQDDTEPDSLDFFCYKGQFYKEKWEVAGYDYETYGSMIYTIKPVNSKQMTIVFDKCDEESKKIVDKLIQILASTPPLINDKLYK